MTVPAGMAERWCRLNQLRIVTPLMIARSPRADNSGSAADDRVAENAGSRVWASSHSIVSSDGRLGERPAGAREIVLGANTARPRPSRSTLARTGAGPLACNAPTIEYVQGDARPSSR